MIGKYFGAHRTLAGLLVANDTWPDAEWVLVADDDNDVDVSKVRRYLAQLDSSVPLLLAGRVGPGRNTVPCRSTSDGDKWSCCTDASLPCRARVHAACFRFPSLSLPPSLSPSLSLSLSLSRQKRRARFRSTRERDESVSALSRKRHKLLRVVASFPTPRAPASEGNTRHVDARVAGSSMDRKRSGSTTRPSGPSSLTCARSMSRATTAVAPSRTRPESPPVSPTASTLTATTARTSRCSGPTGARATSYRAASSTPSRASTGSTARNSPVFSQSMKENPHLSNSQTLSLSLFLFFPSLSLSLSLSQTRLPPLLRQDEAGAPKTAI